MVSEEFSNYFLCKTIMALVMNFFLEYQRIVEDKQYDEFELSRLRLLKHRFVQVQDIKSYYCN